VRVKMQTATITQKSEAIAKLEREIFHNFMTGSPFIASSNIKNLRAHMNELFCNVYRTRADVEKALVERVEDIREKVILDELSLAKTLAAKRNRAYFSHSDWALNTARTAIPNYSHKRNYSWVNDAIIELDREYSKACGKPLTQFPQPAKPIEGIVDLSALVKHEKESPRFRRINEQIASIDNSIYNCFVALCNTDPAVSAKEMNNLMNRIADLIGLLDKVYGIHQQDDKHTVFHVEAMREKAVLDFMKLAKNQAKKGNAHYSKPLRFAVKIACLEIPMYVDVLSYNLEKPAYGWLQNAGIAIAKTYEHSIIRQRKK
jgi:hypothetical protein